MAQVLEKPSSIPPPTRMKLRYAALFFLWASFTCIAA